MERCHLYAQIKLAKNIGPFKVPAVLLYVSNGKIAPDPGFYYYCYYLKCHLRKKNFHSIPTLLGEAQYKNK